MNKIKNLKNKLDENNINLSFQDVSEKNKEDYYEKLFEHDFSHIISMNKLIKKDFGKSLTPIKILISYLQADEILRSATWSLIRGVEENLTASLQYKFGFKNPGGDQFHLIRNNFNNRTTGSWGERRYHKRSFNDFMRKLKQKQRQIIKYSDNPKIRRTRTISFSTLLSHLSYGDKYKILKFLRKKDQNIIFESFYAKDENVLWIFKQLKVLRNQVAHNDTILDKYYESEKGKWSKKLNISGIIKNVVFLSLDKDINIFDNFLMSIKDKEIIKRLSQKKII